MEPHCEAKTKKYIIPDFLYHSIIQSKKGEKVLRAGPTQKAVTITVGGAVTFLNEKTADIAVTIAYVSF